jgi:hypothetical protein
MKGEAAPPQLRRHCGHLRRPRAPSRVTLVGKVDRSPRSCREEETRAEKAIRRSCGSADSSRDRRPRSGRSASVVVSPRLLKSSPAILRRMRRMILPERVFGRPDENWIMSGEAIGPISLRTQVTSSWRNASDGYSPRRLGDRAHHARPGIGNARPHQRSAGSRRRTAASPSRLALGVRCGKAASRCTFVAVGLCQGAAAPAEAQQIRSRVRTCTMAGRLDTTAPGLGVGSIRCGKLLQA